MMEAMLDPRKAATSHQWHDGYFARTEAFTERMELDHADLKKAFTKLIDKCYKNKSSLSVAELFTTTALVGMMDVDTTDPTVALKVTQALIFELAHEISERAVVSADASRHRNAVANANIRTLSHQLRGSGGKIDASSVPIPVPHLASVTCPADLRAVPVKNEAANVPDYLEVGDDAACRTAKIVFTEFNTKSTLYDDGAMYDAGVPDSPITGRALTCTASSEQCVTPATSSVSGGEQFFLRENGSSTASRGESFAPYVPSMRTFTMSSDVRCCMPSMYVSPDAPFTVPPPTYAQHRASRVPTAYAVLAFLAHAVTNSTRVRLDVMPVNVVGPDAYSVLLAAVTGGPCTFVLHVQAALHSGAVVARNFTLTYPCDSVGPVLDMLVLGHISAPSVTATPPAIVHRAFTAPAGVLASTHARCVAHTVRGRGRRCLANVVEDGLCKDHLRATAVRLDDAVIAVAAHEAPLTLLGDAASSRHSSAASVVSTAVPRCPSASPRMRVASSPFPHTCCAPPASARRCTLSCRAKLLC
jgi:hypothetical protein